MSNLTNEFRKQLTRRIVAHRFKKATVPLARLNELLDLPPK